MADGSEKNIEDVQVGERVISYDFTTKKQVVETVLQLERPIKDHYFTLYFDNGKTLRLTREHPVWNSLKSMLQ